MGCRARPGGLPAAPVQLCLAAAAELCAPEGGMRYFLWARQRKVVSTCLQCSQTLVPKGNVAFQTLNCAGVTLTCTSLLVSVLDESMCGADEQAQIHSDPELPM